MTNKKEPAFGEWQPIETAPNDGEYIILFNPTYPHPDVNWLAFDGVPESSSFIRGATHWMPLPKPPIAKTEAP